MNHDGFPASHPHPVADYAEALRRVSEKIAGEIHFNPSSHTILLTHGARTPKAIAFVHGYPSSPHAFKDIAARVFDRGYNVLAMTLPYHGLADRMNTEHEKLRAEDFTRYADNVVDIAHGLGDRVTMVGISGGSLVTGWAAQERRDLDLAVLISPGFGFKAIPRFVTPLMGWAWRAFPNTYIWDDPEKKANSLRTQNYLRLSTHALGEIVRLSRSIQPWREGAPPRRAPSESSRTATTPPWTIVPPTRWSTSGARARGRRCRPTGSPPSSGWGMTSSMSTTRR